MVKSHRSKRHHKKHRGGEGESTDNNSVLTMDESPAAAETAMPATATPATASAMPATATPAEEEKKGWFSSLFGGSKTKRVRFKRTRKTKRSTTKSKRNTRKHKRSSTKRSSTKRSGSKRKGSSRK